MTARAGLLFALGLLAGSCKQAPIAEAGPEPVSVHCVKPVKEAVEDTVSLRGRIEPPPGGDLSVASQVAGRVVSVNVKEGSRVTAGQIVASIDDAPVRDAARQTDAALAQARAASVNAEATLERTRALVARGIAARQELEDATAKAEAAKQGVAAAAAGSDLARRTLGKVQVQSGLAGVVTKVFRGPGALVDGTPATPVLQLAGSSAAELVADVTQRELVLLAEGQAARGAVSGEGGLELEGTVRSRPRSLDMATGLGTVRIALTSEGVGDLPIGTFARVVVTIQKREALVVPVSALRGTVSDGVEVMVCAGDKAALKLVKIGYRDDRRVEVLEASENEELAIDHVLALDDGTPIKRLP